MNANQVDDWEKCLRSAELITLHQIATRVHQWYLFNAKRKKVNGIPLIFFGSWMVWCLWYCKCELGRWKKWWKCYLISWLLLKRFYFVEQWERLNLCINLSSLEMVWAKFCPSDPWAPESGWKCFIWFWWWNI